MIWLRGGRRRVALSVVLSGLVLLGVLVGQDRVEEPAAGQGGPAEPASGALHEGTGLYASAVRSGDGSIDVAATIAELGKVGASRYYYLVADVPAVAQAGMGRGEMDWKSLPAFAAAAGAADIDVVVYLVPPLQSTATTYRPFGWDYRTWLRAVGRVARAHPAITGVAIDDFGAATDARTGSKGHPLITPSLIAEGKAQARRESPGLRLYAVTYTQDFAAPTARLAPFRPYLDGVIHAFSGPGNLRHAPQNTTDPNGVAEVSAFVRRTTSCGGGDWCQQATFAPSADPVQDDVLDLTRTVTAARGQSEVVVDFADDLLTDAEDRYSISVFANGRALATRREEAGSWHRLVAAVEGAGQSVDLVIRLRRTGGAGPFSVWTLPRVGGEAPGRDAREWKSSSAGLVDAAVVHPLRVVLLAYAARLGSERETYGAADARYLSKVAEGAAAAAKSGTIDGLAVYRLNLGGSRSDPLQGDPANVAVVVDLFRVRR